ncbi:hypothetical protein MesoLjLb_10680 [Mesorhizobium sp. L-8-3]|nr:hypothetical protein MesoLjLb_10680 [Mesorhizobium sp. L-8-3]
MHARYAEDRVDIVGFEQCDKGLPHRGHYRLLPAVSSDATMTYGLADLKSDGLSSVTPAAGPPRLTAKAPCIRHSYHL